MAVGLTVLLSYCIEVQQSCGRAVLKSCSLELLVNN